MKPIASLAFVLFLIVSIDAFGADTCNLPAKRKEVEEILEARFALKKQLEEVKRAQAAISPEQWQKFEDLNWLTHQQFTIWNRLHELFKGKDEGVAEKAEIGAQMKKVSAERKELYRGIFKAAGLGDFSTPSKREGALPGERCTYYLETSGSGGDCTVSYVPSQQNHHYVHNMEVTWGGRAAVHSRSQGLSGRWKMPNGGSNILWLLSMYPSVSTVMDKKGNISRGVSINVFMNGANGERGQTIETSVSLEKFIDYEARFRCGERITWETIDRERAAEQKKQADENAKTEASPAT